VIRAFPQWRACSGYQIEFSGHVAPELWQNRDVVLAWFRSGGSFIGSRFSGPPEFKKDEEICLLIAEHGSESSFVVVPSEFTSNKDFMLQAIGHKASHFFHASSALQKDFHIVVAALARSQSFQDVFSMASRFLRCHTTPAFIHSIRARVRAKLAVRDCFMRVVLPAVSLGNRDSCCLRLLQQGNETETSFKKLIAEYLDVPIGREYSVLRKASKNLPDEEVEIAWKSRLVLSGTAAARERN
jgi:hypothetical protein